MVRYTTFGTCSFADQCSSADSSNDRQEEQGSTALMVPFSPLRTFGQNRGKDGQGVAMKGRSNREGGEDSDAIDLDNTDQRIPKVCILVSTKN